MLEKGKDPILGSLCIIQIAEADLNFVLKIIWAVGMQHHAVKHKLLDPAQTALLGKTCYSAVFSKVLFIDICRQMRYEGCYMETDAKACFDRVLPTLAIITCRRLGLAPPNSSILYSGT
jgi:hypothetical protein